METFTGAPHFKACCSQRRPMSCMCHKCRAFTASRLMDMTMMQVQQKTQGRSRPSPQKHWDRQCRRNWSRGVPNVEHVGQTGTRCIGPSTFQRVALT